MPYDRTNGRDGGRADGQRARGSGRVQRSRRNTPQTDLFHSDLANEPVSRYAFLALGLGLASVMGVARLADYQLFNADRYQGEADARRLLSQTLYAKRGTIYDRNGNVLASSVECRNVCLNPSIMKKKDRKKAVKAIVDILGEDEKTVRELTELDKTWVYVKRQVDLEDAEKLADMNIRGIEFEQAMKRVYPYGSVASQVLGVVNVDNKGVSGLEAQYDDILTGTNGSLVRERALDGTYIAGGAYKKVPAKDGADIVLTIDANIQQVAEQAMAEGVKNAGAKYGSAIVSDPQTGEIFAACSNPTFDQNDLENADYAAMNLRVVTDAYEPGSVFKTFVCGAAIDQGLVTTDTTFQVPATVQVGDDIVGDADKRDYGMTMSVREILRRSSNTGMVLVGEKLGADDFDKHVIKGFGFGKNSGVDFPGESLGIIRDRKKYDGASLGAMSFGQSLAVSPIEVVRAMSAIANKGVMTTPHFLKSRSGSELDWTDGEERAIGEDAAKQVASMMQTVVDEGTGKGAQIPGYAVAGKTGTAERTSEKGGGYAAGNYMSSFFGFVSTDNPQAMCYITLDGTPAGSDAALPMFTTIMETALPTLGIKPTR